MALRSDTRRPAKSATLKRILHVSLNIGFGGTENYLLNLVELNSGWAEPYLICTNEKLKDEFAKRSVPVIQLPLPGWARMFRTPLTILILPFVVWSRRIDIVHINGAAEIAVLPVARMLGCKAIATRHLTWELDEVPWYVRPRQVLVSMLYRFCSRFASAVVCVSEHVASQTRQIVPPSRVVVISNWVPEVESPKALRDTLEPQAEILFVGRLEPNKGVQTLVQAMRGLSGAKLIIAGEGTYRSHLEELAAGLDIDFIGFHPKPQLYYESCDVFVNPSLGLEGLPLVSLEAMSRGIPCIFSNIPVHAEITDGGRTALLFEAGNVESLRAALLHIVEDDSHRRQLAKNAYERVRAIYDPGTAARAYQEVFGAAAGLETT
jgi:glycosyltransferase involved in cell wall biosynthesis